MERIVPFLAVLLVTAPVHPQGPSPAVSEPYDPALPGYVYEFPRDHGVHERFRTEWWYFTGHVETDSGEFGFELTFFRVGVRRPPEDSRTLWDLRDLGLAHFAITDIGRREFRYHEKLNRISPFTAGARPSSMNVFNEGWSVTTTPEGRYRLRARAGGDAIDLIVQSRKPPAIHGENGVSVKAEGRGNASHYYSLTRLAGSGTIVADGRTRRGRVLAWMDHEFGSSALRENQIGWDWFSLQLDNDTELMLYQIRRRDGSRDVTSSGSFILGDGTVIHLGHEQFTIEPLGSWRSPRSGAEYPMGWKIEVRPLNIRLRIREMLRDQELVTSASTRVTYWEGAVETSGSFGGTPVRGKGYVELTGYAAR